MSRRTKELLMQLSDIKMHTTLHWLWISQLTAWQFLVGYYSYISPELEVTWVKYPAFLIVLPAVIMRFSQPLKLYNVQLQLCWSDNMKQEEKNVARIWCMEKHSFPRTILLVVKLFVFVYLNVFSTCLFFLFFISNSIEKHLESWCSRQACWDFIPILTNCR